MVQCGLLLVSIGLIFLGIKALLGKGLMLSRNKTLTGTPAKVVGVLCILFGLALTPLAYLIMFAVSR
jgi:hypothetical protein